MLSPTAMYSADMMAETSLDIISASAFSDVCKKVARTDGQPVTIRAGHTGDFVPYLETGDVVE
jgi:hypothetical protein